MGLVESGIGSQGVGPDIWIGDEKSVFKFVSFAPTIIAIGSRTEITYKVTGLQDILTLNPRCEIL
jgi:hypothetical protein